MTLTDLEILAIAFVCMAVGLWLALRRHKRSKDAPVIRNIKAFDLPDEHEYLGNTKARGPF